VEDSRCETRSLSARSQVAQAKSLRRRVDFEASKVDLDVLKMVTLALPGLY
jgi:hypothetical protein